MMDDDGFRNEREQGNGRLLVWRCYWWRDLDDLAAEIRRCRLSLKQGEWFVAMGYARDDDDERYIAGIKRALQEATVKHAAITALIALLDAHLGTVPGEGGEDGRAGDGSGTQHQ